MKKFKCPHCKQPIAVEDDMLGTSIECPSCNGGFRLPAPAAPPAPKAPAPQAPTTQAPDPSVQPQIKGAPDVPNLKVPDVPKLQPEESAPEPAPSGKKKIVVKSRAGGGSATGAQTKPCPFCGEDIMRTAKKCRHCGEFLTTGGKKAKKKKAEPKNGALIGAIACFIIGLVFLLQSVATYVVYGPLFALAMLFGIIAIVQMRVVLGVIMIILSVVLPATMYYNASEGDKKAAGFSAGKQYGQTTVQEYPDENEELIHSNLKKIEDAKKEWLSKAPMDPEEAPEKGAVGRFIEGGFPKAPAGATYSVNKVGTPAKCWYKGKKFVYGE